MNPSSTLVDQYGYPLSAGQNGMGSPLDHYDQIDAEESPQFGRQFRVRREDQLENVWPADYNPKNIRNVLNAAAQGQPILQHQAFDQMMEADPTLPGIYETRMNAILNKQWEIVSASEVVHGAGVDEDLAQKTADYCREKFSKIYALDDALSHLLDGIGRSCSVCEIEWAPDGTGHSIRTIIPVNHRSVIGDPTFPWKLRVRTTEHAYPGLLIDAERNKWAVHCPRMIGMNPFRGGTHRICLMLSIIRRYGFQWWSSALELFGTPYRKGTYPPNASSDAKTQMDVAMKNMGHAGYAIFPPDAELELFQAMSGAEKWPHGTLVSHIDDRYAILLLGQTLTTNPSDKGTQALGTVHDRVREDVRDADIKREGDTIRRDILTPLVRLGPFAPDAPVPFFRRIVEEPKDHKAVLDVLDGAVNRLKLQVRLGHAYDKLDIPIPDGVDSEGFIEAAPAPDPFGFGGGDPDADPEDDPPEPKPGDDPIDEKKKPVTPPASRRRLTRSGRPRHWVY